ncbi:MAG: hypothetical protein ACLRZH_07965 [Ruthenibacterium lactatiformans]
MREMLPGFAVRGRHASLRGRGQREHPRGVPCGRVPYRRLLRGASALPPDSVVVPDAPAAARWLAGTQGNILLATGAKELPPLRGWTRSGCTRGCCPRTRGLRPARRRACHGNIIALQGLLRGNQRGADAPF